MADYNICLPAFCRLHKYIKCYQSHVMILFIHTRALLTAFGKGNVTFIPFLEAGVSSMPSCYVVKS